ncbi:hypothetical protein GTZ99_11075 [Novosphingobium sp. FSY-8]|uniref:OmpR/PhoB-type domain-containing protein n=1 Tax=Novosphingobium ovatum TaxID=1908523 RepID=A0ABW9XF16_9SPHN|nr:hypothetical protein [Novosphingobium ovatum]NBC37099.1 hypothetical protein [Novosphingobium ovatum]
MAISTKNIDASLSHNSRDDRPAFQFDVDIIFPDEMRVRYLSFNDYTAWGRTEWLKSVFHFYEEYGYSEQETNFVSTANSDYDALIIGGNDVNRIVKVLRTYAPILRNKLKLCLLSNTTPPKRARAISAGFDDAMDIDRIAPREATYRIRAMWNRYLQSFQRHSEEQQRFRRLAQIADVARLTDREKEILINTVESKEQNISYRKIRNLLERPGTEITDKHIQVIACGMRKKMVNGFTLKCINGFGYKLHTSQK